MNGGKDSGDDRTENGTPPNSEADPDEEVGDGTTWALRAIDRIASAYEGARSREAEHSSPGGDTATGPGVQAEVDFEWGPLQVRMLLAQGAFGRVYQAVDPKLQRRVALKLQPAGDDASDRALAEARRLARVRHPNVLTVHGADVHDGWVGVWTDLLEGQTLEERLRTEGPIDALEAALVGIDLCRALTAVHDASLVHGDIKAANVMRESNGTIVLLDFGSSRILREIDGRGSDRSALEEDEELSGTPLVTAPEIFGGASTSPATDIYALGVLLYRLTSAQYPVQAATMEDLLDAHRTGRRTPLATLRPDLPEAFVETAEQALDPDPEKRYASAVEMGRRLAAFRSSALPEARGAVTAGVCPNNLPREVSSFIGRETQLQELRRLVAGERFVSLVGTGGSGKTRLGLQVASALASGVFEEVRFVELANVVDSQQVLRAIGKAFGLRESPAQDWVELLSGQIGDRKVLVLFDNCEHLLDSCRAAADELLRSNGGLHVLTTSRETLGGEGERVYPIPPMQVPSEPAGLSAETLQSVESVNLFLDRARAYGSRLEPERDELDIVAEICRRLDGIPLALEIAAARTRSLSVAQIRERLADRFALLTSGKSALPRHRTLEVMIEWSHELLTDVERTLFRRLSVFLGGWSLEAAEDVCSGDGLERSQVLDVLASLVDKSLVERDAEREDASARYRMLETLRAYAERQLRAKEEHETLADRHRDYFGGLARQTVPRMRTPEEETWMARIRNDSENVGAALERALDDRTDLAFGLQFAGDVGRIWFVTGQWSEAREYCMRMLARPGSETVRTSARLSALIEGGYIGAQQGAYDEAQPLLEDALSLALEMEDEASISATYGRLGNLAYARGHLDQGMEYQQKSLAISRKLGDVQRIGICLSNIGNIHHARGQMAESRVAHEQSMQAAKEAGDLHCMAYSLCRLGDVGLEEKQLEDAQKYYQESLSLRRELGDRWGVAVTLVGLAEAKRLTGDPREALSLLREGLEILQELGDLHSTSKVIIRLGQTQMSLDNLPSAMQRSVEAVGVAARIQDFRDLSDAFYFIAQIALRWGEGEEAARALGVTDQFAERSDPVIAAHMGDRVAEVRREIEARFDSANVAAWFEEGRSMNVDVAIEHVRNRWGSPDSWPKSDSHE